MAGKISANQGKLGENIAADYLVGMGYTILSRNFRGGSGELDIICQKEDVVYFAEVKARKPNAMVTAAESITPNKRIRMKSAVLAWMAEKNKMDIACSFLLVFIQLPTATQVAKIEVIEDYI